MSKQNIYDSDAFFESFQSSRSKKVNFNDCIETPILFAMLPDLHGKKILDIGCGMGQHAKQYSEMGAESVQGIDISEKMLDYAQKHNSAENVVYQRMAMEDIGTINQQFDLVTSSLVFDYVEDFGGLMRKVYMLMTATEDEGYVPEKAISGLQGWVDCFEKAELAGTLFCGGISDPGEASGNKEAQDKAYEFGKSLE